jgi:hypothetical protein
VSSSSEEWLVFVHDSAAVSPLLSAKSLHEPWLTMRSTAEGGISGHELRQYSGVREVPGAATRNARLPIRLAGCRVSTICHEVAQTGAHVFQRDCFPRVAVPTESREPVCLMRLKLNETW